MKQLRDLVPGAKGGPLVGMAVRLETADGVEFMIIAPSFDDLKVITGQAGLDESKVLEFIIMPSSRLKVVDMDKCDQTTH